MRRPGVTTVALLAGLLAAVPAWAGDWDETAREARKLMRRESLTRDFAKRDLLREIAADDSARAAELLVDWALASRKEARKLDKAFQREVAKVRRKIEKLDRKAARKKAKTGEDDPELALERRELVAELDTAREVRDAERAVDVWAAEAAQALTSEEAWAWMFEVGVPKLLDARYDGHVLDAVVGRVGEDAGPREVGLLVRIAGAEGAPAARVRALDRVGAIRPQGARDAVVAALDAGTVAVRRAALRALWRLDDPACVPALVEAMKTAYGLVAMEVDDLLFFFTGVSMGGDGDAWQRWWAEHGAAWKATGRHERHERRVSPGDAAFYGIRSPSKRIVFVIDHSGSMSKPSGGLHATTGEPMGKPRMVEARAELVRAIDALADDVRFNVIFYSGDVASWKEPPELLRATGANKAEAITWVGEFEPETSTALFDALDAVFDYANEFGSDAKYADPGVDTVFLLTDGVPTRDGGETLSAADIDRALDRFEEKNVIHRIVVHAVGVGRGHDRRLMERLAKRTGGNYVSVATE